MLILSIFIFLFGVLLTVFGAFRIGQSNVKVTLDDSIKEVFSNEVQKFMDKHSTQEKIVVSMDSQIESIFNKKLKEIEIASKTRPTSNCKHNYYIHQEGSITRSGNRIGSYYDMRCLNCGDMYRKELT